MADPLGGRPGSGLTGVPGNVDIDTPALPPPAAGPARSRFGGDIGMMTAANIVAGAMGVLQGLLVARWLEPRTYGIIVLVTTYPSLIHGFLDLRSSEASVKYLSEFHVRGEGTRALGMAKLGYTLDMLIAALTVLLVMVTAPWVESRIVHTPGTALLMSLFAASFLPAALAKTSYAVLAVTGRFAAIAVVNAAAAALTLIGVLGVILAGQGVPGIVAAIAVGRAVPGVWLGVLATRQTRDLWQQSWLRSSWTRLGDRRREILSFLFYSDLLALLGVIPKQLDIMLLGYFRGPTETAYYKLGKSLVGMLSYVVGPASSVSYAALARLWAAGQWPALLQMVRQMHLVVGLPMAGVAAAVVPALPWLIRWVVGEPYAPAGPVAQLLMIAQLPVVVFFALGPLLLIWGQVKVRVVMRLITMLGMLLGFFIVIPRAGAMGLAWVLLGTYLTGPVLYLAWIAGWGARRAAVQIPRPAAGASEAG